MSRVRRLAAQWDLGRLAVNVAATTVFVLLFRWAGADRWEALAVALILLALIDRDEPVLRVRIDRRPSRGEGEDGR